MDRAERAGLGVAVVGHVALFAILSLGIVSRVKLPPMKSEPIDVVLTDEVGLKTAVPQPAQEEPAPATAPEPAPPEPAVEPTPPPPPTPAPSPTPAPKPAPRSRDVPEAGPRPAPAPKPQPREETPPPPRERVSQEDRRRPDNTRSRVTTRTAAQPRPPSASRLASVMENLSDGQGRARAPRASALSPLAVQGLNAAIKRQVQPCYELGALAGTPAMQIVTVLRLRFSRDGNVSGTPTVTDQTGVDGSNSAYKQQIIDVARRAVLRCAPLRLPAELYDVGDGQGWNDIEFTFRPGEFG